MSRPAPPNRTEKEWPRFPRKGEREAGELPDRPTGYIILRRVLSAMCGLGVLIGVALYACSFAQPQLYLEQGTVMGGLLAGLFAVLLFAISNSDGSVEPASLRGARWNISYMQHAPGAVRVAAAFLMLSFVAGHAFELYKLAGGRIFIKEGKYALYKVERRSSPRFVRWLSPEEFLVINARQLRRLGTGAMILFLLPTINFWFLREKLD